MYGYEGENFDREREREREKIRERAILKSCHMFSNLFKLLEFFKQFKIFHMIQTFQTFQQTCTLFTFVYLCSNDASVQKFCACFLKV